MLFVLKNIIDFASLLKFNLTQNLNSEKKDNKYQYGKFYKSNDGKCILQEIVQHHRNDIIAIYKIIHEDGVGSITVKLHDLPQYKIKVLNKILTKAEQGNLEKAEYSLKKYKNMNVDLYTHRLYIITKKNKRYIHKIIDLKLYSSTNGYNNYFTKRIFLMFLKKIINKTYDSNYQDAIICLLKESWGENFIKLTAKFYKNQNYHVSDLGYKIIYCHFNKS